MRVKIANLEKVLEADSNKELVEKILFGNDRQDMTLIEAMRNYARRAVMWSNTDIRTDSVDVFVSDLVKHKHIEIVEE